MIYVSIILSIIAIGVACIAIGDRTRDKSLSYSLAHDIKSNQGDILRRLIFLENIRSTEHVELLRRLSVLENKKPKRDKTGRFKCKN